MKCAFIPRWLRLAVGLGLALSPSLTWAQAPDPSGAWLWATSPGAGVGTCAALDAAGNVYLTGSFCGTATFGATVLTSVGASEVFVAKLTSAGDYQWAVRADGAVGTGLAVDGGGNVYVTGFFSGATASFGAITLTNSLSCTHEVFVAKLTPDGHWQWAVAAGGAGHDESAGLTVDRSGNAWVTGEFRGLAATFGATTLTSPTPAGDLFVARLTPVGEWAWAASAGGPLRDAGRAVAVDGSGYCYVTGGVAGPDTSFGPVTLPASPGLGASNAFVARLTPTGGWQWATRAGGGGTDHGSALGIDDLDNAYVTGQFSGPAAVFGPDTLANSSPAGGSADLFVAKLSPAGAWQWAVGGGGPGSDFGSGLAVAPTGALYLTGGFGGPAAAFGRTVLRNPGGSTNAFIALLTSTGYWQSAQTGHGDNHASGQGLAVDSTGNVYATGHFTSETARFGDQRLLNSLVGNCAIFIGCNRLLPPPNAEVAIFHLYPNPTQELVRLTGIPGTPVAVFDGLGQLVRSTRLSAAGAATLPLSGLLPGFYVVRAGRATRRLVIRSPVL